MTETFCTIATAPAAAKLQELAHNPYDLTGKDSLLSDGRITAYSCHTRPFRLLYATQRVDAAVMKALQELADECGLVRQFATMRRGAVLNQIHGYESEKRQVLHTACRDIFTERPKEAAATAKAKAELEKLKVFLAEIEDGSVVNAQGDTFTTMINVGIGGSDLGPRSVYEALKPYGKPGRRVHFIANVDPDDASEVLASLDLARTLVVIVSKSGSTLETLTNQTIVAERLKAAGLDPARHCLAVTGQGSPMDDPDKYLRSFYIYDYVGGRYSSTSMVGAVVLGFYLGYDRLVEFLQGAADIDELAENIDIHQNIPLLLALFGVWNHNFLGASTVAILPYSQGLHRFPAHLQQCDMESNGKAVDRDGREVLYKTGPIVWGEPGTNGQHAFYQLLHQGTEVVPVEFIGFLNNQYCADITVKGSTSQEKLIANLLAQAIAMATGQKSENPNKIFPGNRPSSILLADRLTPKTMGALLAIYEAKIVFQGFLWNINSFDQEGVQLGKVLATRILTKMKEKGSGELCIETEFLKSASVVANHTIAR
jgi:glucose-6-phosphate isomerase